MIETAVTRKFTVEVHSRFVPEQSDPSLQRYFFAYRIRIYNGSGETVQLLSRHWRITDGLGRTEEVKGPGVVGEQPHLLPGKSFEYESFCPLPTSSGSMQGTYQMQPENGPGFDIEIPLFYLVDPTSYH